MSPSVAAVGAPVWLERGPSGRRPSEEALASSHGSNASGCASAGTAAVTSASSAPSTVAALEESSSAIFASSPNRFEEGIEEDVAVAEGDSDEEEKCESEFLRSDFLD